MTPHVYITTAVFNDYSHTKKLLSAINKQTYPKLTSIILDDASTDNTIEQVHQNFPKVVVLESEGDNWWTGGLNKSIAHALKLAQPGDFILTINNDCVINKDYVATIVSSSIKLQRAIVGSIELDMESHRVKTGLIHIDWAKGNWTNNRHIKKVTQAEYHNTKGVLFPVEVFSKIGLLDQKHLPHYASDIEFTHRAVQAGYKLFVDPSCKVYCDQKRTGLTPSSGNTLASLWKLAFSRKSTINIIDHFYLVTLTCPPQLKLINYLRLIGKVLYLGKKALWH